MGPNNALFNAEEIYNNYLLLYKLNEIKDDSGKLVKDIIFEAISQGKEQVKFKIRGSAYKIIIAEKDDGYELKVLGDGAKPEIKDLLKYAVKDIVDLWAQSKVSIEKSELE